MLGSDDDAVVADVISVMADDHDLVGSDLAERLITIRVTQSYDYSSLV